MTRHSPESAPNAQRPLTGDTPGIKDRVGRIEQHGVEFIPEEERHSSPRNLTSILFGGSLTFSVIIIGWFPVSFGLGWWQAASAVVVGSAVGAALLAPTGLMGPRSGTNNPVASGAFFGVAGRLIGSILEASASVAFAALSIWTGGDALAGALTRFFGLTDTDTVRLIAYAVLAVVVTIVSVLGHSSMVFCQRVMIPTAGACLIVGLFVFGGHFDPDYTGTHEYALGSMPAAWLLSALLCASTVASYGPYAGDWTRHISPRKHPDISIARALFIGGLFGMGGPFMWGVFTSVALFAGAVPGADTSYVLALVDASPLWFVPALIYVGLASGTAQAVINTYGTGLDTSAIIPKLNRVQATLLACSLATILVYLGHFNSALANGVAVFLTLLACSSIPWIVILTIGHFHRRGYYRTDDLQVFNRGEKGGVYWFTGGLNFVGIGVWLVALTAGLMFTNNQWFTGPGAALLGGLDTGFLVAGVVAAALYPLALRMYPERPELFRPLPDATTPRKG
ncbi:purine-cytosine permease family protein [Mycolicibacterium komossense]|uniref:Cytosine permease n=1 Tax=Mycolicibacterium komossense TaxID=1779 RepID=A0ABT3CFD7_9MYCO|nr:cytosine permease [Mycolicibacterium komossense]MCV7228208.1 cytosine permease [Mycolicibacterium komossense]